MTQISLNPFSKLEFTRNANSIARAEMCPRCCFAAQHGAGDLPVGQVQSRFVKRATRRIKVRTQYRPAFAATKLMVVDWL